MKNLAKIALLSCAGTVAVTGNGSGTVDSVVVSSTDSLMAIIPAYTEWVGAPPGTIDELVGCAQGGASRLVGFTVRYTEDIVHNLRALCVTMATNGNWAGKVTEHGAFLTTDGGGVTPLTTSSIRHICPRDQFVSGLRLHVVEGGRISHIQPYCSTYALDSSGRIYATGRPQPLPIGRMPLGGRWTPAVYCPNDKPIGYGAQQSRTEVALRRVRLSCLETPG